MPDNRYKSEYPPYDPTDINGFSYETVLKRWPIIITNLIDHLYQLNHRMSVDSTVDPTAFSSRITEGNSIIQKASKLKYEMARDKVMEEIIDDGGFNVHVFNKELGILAETGKNTWFKCPWLYAECYLYRLIRSWFATTQHWEQYDPFLAQKEDSFKSSAEAVYKLANTMEELLHEHSNLERDDSKLEVLWDEMIQMCLWGNATDLSLLTNLTQDDINALQTVGKEAQEQRRQFILRDDSKLAWKALRSSSPQGGHVAIILDNAGFELYTDLLFADFLVNLTPYVSSVTFHPKTIPWFVSDVLPPDIPSLFNALTNHAAFFGKERYQPEANQVQAIDRLVQRWKTQFEQGKFKLSVDRNLDIGKTSATADYWTNPYPYWNMRMDGPELLNELKACCLVVFKGDLNFRKLTGDVAWPVSTPFSKAIGPLAGAFPILSLRTNKADVVVGVDENKAKEVEEKDKKWRVNGKYALISFCAKMGTET